MSDKGRVTSAKWKAVPLGDLTALVQTWNPSQSPSSEVFTYIDLSAVDQESKTVVGARNVSCGDAPSRARQLVEVGDVLVSTVRPNLNAVARVPDKLDGATASTGFCILRPRVHSTDGSYLFHWVKSPRFVGEMVRRATGASYPAVSDRIVLETKIPLPPLTEQRRIAEVLDRAEALRAKRRTALAQLAALTQSLFLDLFGDPIGNELNWPKASVANFVAGFESGKSIVADDEEASGSPYRVLKVSAVTSLEYRPEESKALPADYTPPAAHFVRPGDLLFSRANTSELIGATAFVEQTPPNLLLPDKLWRFVWHDEKRADPHFVRFLFQHPKFRAEIGKRATGTSGSMKNISQEKVLGISVGLPPLSLQREFSRRVTAVEKLKATHRAALAELDALFASLQHRAFRGEL